MQRTIANLALQARRLEDSFVQFAALLGTQLAVSLIQATCAQRLVLSLAGVRHFVARTVPAIGVRALEYTAGVGAASLEGGRACGSEATGAYRFAGSAHTPKLTMARTLRGDGACAIPVAARAVFLCRWPFTWRGPAVAVAVFAISSRPAKRSTLARAITLQPHVAQHSVMAAGSKRFRLASVRDAVGGNVSAATSARALECSALRQAAILGHLDATAVKTAACPGRLAGVIHGIQIAVLTAIQAVVHSTLVQAGKLRFVGACPLKATARERTVFGALVRNPIVLVVLTVPDGDIVSVAETVPITVGIHSIAPVGCIQSNTRRVVRKAG